MVDGIGSTSGSVLGRHGEGVCRVHERSHGIEQRVHVSALVVDGGIGDNATAVILRTGSCQRDDVHDGQGLLSLHLIRNQIPCFAVVVGTGGNRFRAVEHRAAAHSQNDVNLLLLANPDTLQHARVVLWVGFDAGQLENLEVLQQVLHEVI